MKLFVWSNGYRTDYSDGLAVAAAETVEEARRVLIESTDDWERKYVAADLAREPDEVLDLPAGRQISGGS